MIPAVLSRMEKQNKEMFVGKVLCSIGVGGERGWCWSAVTFVVYNGEVWMNSKFWHQLKEKSVSSRRLVFVNCTHSLYQL